MISRRTFLTGLMATSALATVKISLPAAIAGPVETATINDMAIYGCGYVHSAFLENTLHDALKPFSRIPQFREHIDIETVLR